MSALSCTERGRQHRFLYCTRIKASTNEKAVYVNEVYLYDLVILTTIVMFVRMYLEKKGIHALLGK